jgi:enamine deaminase RidA (YjgF/YER057c/UK114 family)
MSREYFSTDPKLPFADAVLVDGRTLYLAGRIGLLPGKPRVPDSPEEEAHLVMQGIRSVLAMAGMEMEHLVSVQIFASDVGLWERFNAVYRTYFRGQLPPRAFLGSGTLLFGARFEVMGIAVRGSRRRPG